MEDPVRFLKALEHSDAIIKRILNTLEEDKQSIRKGLSGESEEVYKKKSDNAIEKIKKIQKKIRVLYSESSTGL